MKLTGAATMILACLLAWSTARAEKVDLLLVLAADVSRSINEPELDLQRKGYAAAISDPRVIRAITDGRYHAIALTYVEWSDANEQTVVVDWTIVRDKEIAGGVAATIVAAPRSFAGRTSLSGAIDYAMQRFAAAPADADKRILDISGDGSNNSGRPVTEARDEALATGITINGLVIIETRPTPDFRTHNQLSGGLGKYFENNVIGGPGAFLLQVENFDTFAEAMVRKLVAEIARLPKARPNENKRLTHKMLAGHFEERPAWQRPR